MNLEQWIKEFPAKDLRALANRCRCSTNYLYYVAMNQPSPALARKIEAATRDMDKSAVVTKEELRPDIWGNPGRS